MVEPTSFSYDRTTCHSAILANGRAVMYIAGNATQDEVEEWCEKLRADSKQPIDWHTVAGADVIKTTGDIQLVRESIAKLYPLLYNKVLDRKQVRVKAGQYSDLDPRFILPYKMLE